MAQQLARKPITLLGKKYKPGDPVPMDKVPRGLRRKLVEQGRVVPDSVNITSGKGG